MSKQKFKSGDAVVWRSRSARIPYGIPGTIKKVLKNSVHFIHPDKIVSTLPMKDIVFADSEEGRNLLEEGEQRENERRKQLAQYEEDQRIANNSSLFFNELCKQNLPTENNKSTAMDGLARPPHPLLRHMYGPEVVGPNATVSLFELQKVARRADEAKDLKEALLKALRTLAVCNAVFGKEKMDELEKRVEQMKRCGMLFSRF